MARNQEKAQATLNRLLQAKREEARGPIETRPYLASTCDDLGKCERWRAQIVREIADEVAAIQNGSLGEHTIRSMNDKINKLLREKKHWERQIALLGGAKYPSNPGLGADSGMVLGNSGYYYFGAAKELPGVRELFEAQAAERKRQKRGDLYKLVDAAYYGYLDDDDGLLERLEGPAEKRLIAERMREWLAEPANMELLQARMREQSSSADANGSAPASVEAFRAYVELPTPQEIEQAILERKRREILKKYGALEEAEEKPQQQQKQQPQK